MFDPERAATFHARNGNVDEAIWIIFLSTHFGKHRVHGWRMLRDVYSVLGTGIWTWDRVSADPDGFYGWLNANFDRIGGAFGNHRKYETLRPESQNSTTKVIESFVKLTSPSPSGHLGGLARSVGNDPQRIFDAAYEDLKIRRFGRLAKFDLLCLLGRLNLVPLEPGSPYLRDATGPLKGARLLIDGDPFSSTAPDEIEVILKRLDATLIIGMQVMEDSLCNWQKNPQTFIHFHG